MDLNPSLSYHTASTITIEWKKWTYICTSACLVTQLCLTLCDSMKGSSVHGILQARIPKRVTISFSGRSSWPRDRTYISLTAGRYLTIWATREAQICMNVYIYIYIHVKAMVFPVVMYGCESWTVKKAKSQRIDAFTLWCWKRHFRVPWTARRSNQPILKEISPECWKDWCWSWSSNTLATWCEELTHLKRPWCWETLKAGGEGDDRGWDGWMASPTQWTWVWINSGSWWWTRMPGVLQSMGLQRVRRDWVTGLNWIYSCLQSD